MGEALATMREAIEKQQYESQLSFGRSQMSRIAKGSQKLGHKVWVSK